MTINVYRITASGFRKIQSGAVVPRTFDEIVIGGVEIPIVPVGSGDISTFWQPNLSRGDWEMNGTQLAAGNDLDTALIISLFTDREANADDVIPDGSTDRRGWWGDMGQKYKIGSRLWLIERAKLTADLGPRAVGYVNEALQWMIDDGVAARVDATYAIQFPSLLGMQVVIYRRAGPIVANNFAWAWEGIN